MKKLPEKFRGWLRAKSSLLKPGLPSVAVPVLAVFFLFPALLSAAEDKAVYWTIMDDERRAGYLLGTIHSEDPRVLDFPQSFLHQLSLNQVFAMEMVPDLPTLKLLTEYMHYQDDKGLESRIGPERFVKVRNLLSRYQVPADWVETMKVWAVVMTLSVPPPQTGFFMDLSLSLRAAGSGMRVVGLETLDQQLSFLEDMPIKLQLDLLDQALENYDTVGEVHARMVSSYLSGDLQALTAEVEVQLSQLAPEARDYFISHGIIARNHRMLESLLPLLSESQVFVAVGALHLPGEHGLVSLLREKGYQLQAETLPLSAPDSP